MKISMNLNQYNSYKSGEKSLLQIKKENIFDKYLNEQLSNYKFRTKVITVLAILMKEKMVHASDFAIIDNVGLTLLQTVQKFSYYACLIMCIIEILKCLASKETGDITKVVTKYSLAFAAVYFMPALFDFIQKTFGRF